MTVLVGIIPQVLRIKVTHRSWKANYGLYSEVTQWKLITMLNKHSKTLDTLLMEKGETKNFNLPETIEKTNFYLSIHPLWQVQYNVWNILPNSALNNIKIPILGNGNCYLQIYHLLLF